MKYQVRPWLRLALTILVVLAVYFQTISHPFSRFDDPFIYEYYGNNSTLSFLDVITPGSGFYYRPLVNLSYWLDFQLWGMNPSFMHLENIIVHLVNVLLVYLIASRLPAASKTKSLPYLCALLFGLHPINSESVNWIAGRTDVFAGMLIFFAVYFLIRSIQEQSTRFAIFAFLAAIVGTLTKETAVMFIPAALLVTICWPFVSQNVSLYKAWRVTSILVPLFVSSCLVFSLLMLVYIKRHGDNAISMMFDGSANKIIRIVEAFGFYAKKVFLPLPLNVAIREVDPLYAIVGIVTIGILAINIRRSDIPCIFFSLAAVFILPALVVATTPIAWTPFGERYLYIPSAFVVIGSLELSHRFLGRLNAVNWFVPIASVIIVSASIATIHRGMLWGDNLALIEDIVVKSPDFGVARNEYGAELIQDGRYNEAENQFRIAAQQINQESVNRIIQLNLIGVKLHGKTPNEARSILLSKIGNKVDGDVELLKLLYKSEEGILGGTVSLEHKRKIVSDMIETNDSLYHKTRESHYLYRSGQLALSIGNKQNAAVYFKKAYENARPDDYYREPALRLAKELGAK